MEEQSKALTALREQTAVVTWSPEDIELIKDTVCKGATDKEFKLFLYRCKNMGLDPLKPGQIHFVKYGNNPGTMIVGIEGFRVRASRTGKHAGTRRGIMRDKNGKCVGAFADVYRSDWQQPAHEEVSLSEYNTGKSNWAKMPETMIKKVAEASALRMAFPDELGGVYTKEEMDQAEEHRVEPISEPAPVRVVEPQPRAVTTKDRDALLDVGRANGWAPAELKDHFHRNYPAKKALTDLTWEQYEEFLKHLADNPKEPSPDERAADAMEAREAQA